MSHRQDMSRVQRELLELREKGLASSQKDKYKDCECVVLFFFLWIESTRFFF